MAANPFDKTSSNGAAATKTKGGLAAANGDGEPTVVGPRDPFALPSSGGGDYKISDFLGELLAIRPTSLDTMTTKIAADSEVIHCDVLRLDNDNERVDDLLIFQTALRSTLKKVLRGPNEWLLGRLELGEAKSGKNAPYILTVPSAEEVKSAQDVMAQLGLL